MNAAIGANRPPRVAEGCGFVLFGVTGDLAHRLVVPALYNLAEAGLLPKDFCIVGVTRSDVPADKLREDLNTSLAKFIKRPVDPEIAKSVLACLSTVRADPSDPASFDVLKKHLGELETRGVANFIFYLAVPPSGFAPISQSLANAGLLKEQQGRWRRLVIEKPFGTDLASARALNQQLLALVDEHQIYRIDHYLGKETVQNILVLRFANGMFEPIWNRNHIDHVQITVSETLDVAHRSSFYDATGALRDMVPNHLFQLLSLVAMEPPARFDAHAVRSEKGEVLAAIQQVSHVEALENSVRGQYTTGKVSDRQVDDYRTTDGVAKNSATETYAALKLSIDNWRWAGVPFYLRTGKALRAKRTEVAIRFKRAPFSMFRDTAIDHFAQNDLVISIEPNEGVTLQFNTKVPGPEIAINGVEMKFRYEDYFKVAPSTGYETLLYDCMTGDNILFQRADGIEAGWAAVEPFIEAWKSAGQDGVQGYAAGSDGPAAADELLERDGRAWRRLTP
ncbi:glucose-6-phosphate 1-dehydrogenase [Variibacter gotjawalensis]|uniref:Glucose-6-phosphate 1-dehydrogenase n=1 Tax=Variibacter gotjawalensis TaxID=1333996 RepID=A0A0S3PUA6_9BRAD|nr:glucose-6-phosphate dehydrogenase [Variibacter gotjawalensis]NIK49883.1 glucose-6-phosphate 1-dehydrogenase [Variibacter gotjawalensis]RZS45882.1 glucose-6-phosphate 1-dehydrogenase [Variibacter gotjawalensis]BAT59557.1 glucose-6-phosphate 1-dehydrogenase [Variibacter gotjawalensis]